MQQEDYMKLTVGDRKRLKQAIEFITAGMKKRESESAAYHLERAEDIIRDVVRGQLWRRV